LRIKGSGPWPRGIEICLRSLKKKIKERGIEMKCSAQNCISTTRSKISAV
jgi:hypothetical protein